MRKNKSSAKPATLPLFALDKTSKASIIRNRKSAADERLALSITQRSWAESLGEGGSLLFMFTITKQFDQRNDDQCQLAQITKGQLELHKRHPSLRTGLRDIFISKKCSLVRCRKPASEGWTVHRYGSTRTAYCSSFLFYQKSPYLAMLLFDTHGHQFAV